MELTTSKIDTLAVPPSPAFTAVALHHEGYIYISGGTPITGSDAPSTNFTRYHIETNTWETLPSMPVARSKHAIAVYGGKIYVAGGLGVTTVHVYNPVSRTWSAFDTSGVSHPYAQLLFVQLGKYVYMLGGYQAGAVPVNKGSRLDLETGEWVDYTSQFGFVNAMRLGDLFHYRNLFYAIPGQYNNVVSSKIFRITLGGLKGVVEEIGTTPTVRFGACYAMDKNVIYAYGGSPTGTSSSGTGDIYKFTLG